jgi:receptor protein-tyrosine kinase
LLVDVDFRRPRQHVLFGSTLTDGLAQAISGDRPPMFSRVEGFPSLAVMTAGACPPNPLELLMDWRFESLVGEWERKFEFIVLDTPPVNEFADALAVATVAGRVLLTGRAKRTSYRDAREMLRRLAATEAQILGSVLNHF